MHKAELKGLIGVIHLGAMPGDPAYRGGGFEAVEQAAMADAQALADGGVDALILENFGSAPFPKGTEGHRLPPHQVAFLSLVTRSCVQRFGLPVGVNCLRNDVISALGIAAATGAAFVRVNVHTGAYVTDQGLIEGEADRSLRYRAALGAERVAIAADVLVKHAAPLAPVGAAEAVHDCLDRGMADAVIVSGVATGAPVDAAVLRQAREAAGARPVLLGSGLTPERVDALAPLASGAIVGTWLKRGGEVRAPVDVERVRRLAGAVKGRFFSGGLAKARAQGTARCHPPSNEPCCARVRQPGLWGSVCLLRGAGAGPAPPRGRHQRRHRRRRRSW